MTTVQVFLVLLVLASLTELWAIVDHRSGTSTFTQWVQKLIGVRGQPPHAWVRQVLFSAGWIYLLFHFLHWVP
jgi:hypothetical protein